MTKKLEHAQGLGTNADPCTPLSEQQRDEALRTLTVLRIEIRHRLLNLIMALEGWEQIGRGADGKDSAETALHHRNLLLDGVEQIENQLMAVPRSERTSQIATALEIVKQNFHMADRKAEGLRGDTEIASCIREAFVGSFEATANALNRLAAEFMVHDFNSEVRAMAEAVGEDLADMEESLAKVAANGPPTPGPILAKAGRSGLSKADKERFFGKGPVRPRTSLMEIEDWLARVDAWLKSDGKVGRFFGMVYSPGSQIRCAMMRLAVDHPSTIAAIERQVAAIDECLKRCDGQETIAEETFTLMQILRTACEIVGKGKSPTKSEPGSEEPTPIDEDCIEKRGVLFWYKGKPLDVPTGRASEVFDRLLQNLGNGTTYKDLGCPGIEPKQVDDQTKRAISEIRKSLGRAKAPYEIRNSARTAYQLRRTMGSKKKAR